jgi:hypothetical protein
MTNFILNVDNEMQNGGEKHPFHLNVLRAVHKFLPCPPVFGTQDRRDHTARPIGTVCRPRLAGARRSLTVTAVMIIERMRSQNDDRAA